MLQKAIMAQQFKTDVTIIGGGLIGLIQALLLGQNGCNVVCIDKNITSTYADMPISKRTTAISYSSHQLLKAANVWEVLRPYACPIKDVQVLDGSSTALLNFDIDDNITAQAANGFGWVIENGYLQNSLMTALSTLENVTLLEDQSVIKFTQHDQSVETITDQNQTIESSLVIGADGRQSFTREWFQIDCEHHDYKQRAIICIVQHANAHQNTAIEHFYTDGPFAVLPMQTNESGHHQSSIVWTEDVVGQKSIMDFNNNVFKTALNARFPEFYGDIISVGTRTSYLLNYIHAHRYIGTRMALIGDAAHGIHPIAGQGLNLGLRDVAELTELILKGKINNEDLGHVSILKNYEKNRKADNQRMSSATHYLNSIFSNNSSTMRLGRRIALSLTNRIKPAKNYITKQAMGTSGEIPKIIRDGKI